MFEVIVFDPQMLNGTVLSTISGLVSPHIVMESCNFLSRLRYGVHSHFSYPKSGQSSVCVSMFEIVDFDP